MPRLRRKNELEGKGRKINCGKLAALQGRQSVYRLPVLQFAPRINGRWQLSRHAKRPQAMPVMQNDKAWVRVFCWQWKDWPD